MEIDLSKHYSKESFVKLWNEIKQHYFNKWVLINIVEYKEFEDIEYDVDFPNSVEIKDCKRKLVTVVKIIDILDNFLLDTPVELDEKYSKYKDSHLEIAPTMWNEKEVVEHIFRIH